MRFLISLCLSLVIGLTCAQAHAADAKPMVKLTTSMGEIIIELNPEKAPITSKNFEEYVKSGFFDGLIFHRVIKDFMIQGGGFDTSMNQKQVRKTIKNEADNGLKNNKYTVAMARTNDPHSASSQFFINTKNNTFLNYTAPNANGWGYAVFGEVIKGFDVVDAIGKVQTGFSGFHQDVPVEQVVIIKAEML